MRLHNVLNRSGKSATPRSGLPPGSRTTRRTRPSGCTKVKLRISGWTIRRRRRTYQTVLQLEPGKCGGDEQPGLELSASRTRRGPSDMPRRRLAWHPTRPFLDTLAMLYLGKGDYAKALEWQSKAVALAPNNLVFRLNLARIHIRGKKDLAARNSRSSPSWVTSSWSGRGHEAASKARGDDGRPSPRRPGASCACRRAGCAASVFGEVHADLPDAVARGSRPC